MEFGYFTLSDNRYPDNPRTAERFMIEIRDQAVYAEKLGMSVPRLALSAPLLHAGRGEEPAGPASRAERLRDWLDAYQVRGSFDDRTLVVLHCRGAEAAAAADTPPASAPPESSPPAPEEVAP